MTNRPLRILQLAHSHPRFHPGGTEMVAMALHRHALLMGQESWYLGACDPSQKTVNPGTQMIAMSADQREAVIFCDEFIRFKLQQPNYFGALREFRNYLDILKPDVVHLHHILNFGLEAIHLVRNALPEARIILTIHDYYLICANNGQLFKHESGQRCAGPTLVECRKCFPNRSEADFVMRALDVSNTLGLVDEIISPSMFLAEKMRANIRDCPEISVIENGYIGPAIAPQPQARQGRRPGPVVFGYFGNISSVKGLADLLAAARMLEMRGHDDFVIQVNGAQLFKDEAMDGAIAEARQRMAGRLQMRGGYEGAEMAERMQDVDCVVFPSRWWENAPLVIYEALAHQKPVLAYPHGGAAEILQRYNTGILAYSSDPSALAEAMQQCMEKPEMMEPKVIPGLPGIEALYEACLGVYG